MANLKEIRDRIVSVKNTRKITEAMRLVAAAKVRRAQEQVLRSRPFADRLARVLENIQSRMKFEAADSPLLKFRDVKTVTLLAVTGDRGLCGGYNTNVINFYTHADIKSIFRKFKIIDIRQDFIFPYKIKPYKRNKYVKLQHSKYMSPKIFEILKKNLGEHLLITLKK